jgi:methylglutaconyl-CoA hydratase
MLVARLGIQRRSVRRYGSSTYKFVELESVNQVLTVNMNRPDLSNAFNEELIAEMIDVFSNVDTTTNKVVVLTGKGKQFSAGSC